MPIDRKTIPQDALALLIEQAQDVAADAHGLTSQIVKGAKADPEQVIRSAQYLLTASSTIAELARVMLMAPGLEETRRELETKFRAGAGG